MQWWLTGDVTWSAPRGLALSFAPALSISVLTIDAVLAMSYQPKPGHGGMMLPAIVATGVVCIGAQLLHLWLIGRRWSVTVARLNMWSSG